MTNFYCKQLMQDTYTPKDFKPAYIQAIALAKNNQSSITMYIPDFLPTTKAIPILSPQEQRLVLKAKSFVSHGVKFNLISRAKIKTSFIEGTGLIVRPTANDSMLDFIKDNHAESIIILPQKKDDIEFWKEHLNCIYFS